MRVEDEIERHVHHPHMLVPQPDGRPGQPEGPDIFERAFPGQRFEELGGVPWRISRRLRQHVQCDRMGKMRLDKRLHPLNCVDVIPVVHALTLWAEGYHLIPGRA